VVLILAVIVALVAAAGALALYLIVSERRRHQHVERDHRRLLAAEKEREAERSRLSDQVISAEQEERRRIALFLHDGPVQSLSGIALMLDAAINLSEQGQLEQSREVIANALDRHRQTIRELRDLSFNLEPVVLRDQGFGTAVHALADQLGMEHELKIEVDVGAADTLAEKAQAALYQIIRDALNGAIRRGPPTWIDVKVEHGDGGRIETVIRDDAPGERRRRSYEALEERARTLSGRVFIEGGDGDGTTLRVVLPPYTTAD
jgi:signal transduction histidine kinase